MFPSGTGLGRCSCEYPPRSRGACFGHTSTRLSSYHALPFRFSLGSDFAEAVMNNIYVFKVARYTEAIAKFTTSLPTAH